MFAHDCLSCLALSGEQRISPGPPIFQGRWWQVEHAYPSALKGWLVIVLRRHAEALHELTRDEFVEFAAVLEVTVRVLASELDCEKEYVAQFAEGTHFHHVHIHVVATPSDLSDTLRGPAIFKILQPDQRESVPQDEIRELCERLRHRFAPIV